MYILKHTFGIKTRRLKDSNMPIKNPLILKNKPWFSTPLELFHYYWNDFFCCFVECKSDLCCLIKY